MRTFIAIELPDEIKGSLAKLQEKLKLSQADVKWVETKNIHLTLKFLGEIDESQLNKISQILVDIAKGNKSFYAKISTLGAFPKISFPRVVWVGLDKGEQEVKRIAGALEEAISGIGIPKEERPFSSHITIGRTRSASRRQSLIDALNNESVSMNKKDLEFPITKVTLFKSVLTPKGPVYEALKEANLTAA